MPGGKGLNQTEQDLLTGLKEKAPRAIYMAYELFNIQLYYFAYKITQHQQESEDIVNQCFNNLWEKESDFPTMGKLKTCLYVYARNKAYDYIRARMVRKRKEPEVIQLYDQPESTVLTEIIQAEIITTLFEAVQALPEKQRTIIMEIEIEGKTAAEVAKAMGLTISDVRESKRRGLAKIRATHGHLAPSLLPLLLTLCKLPT